MVDPNAITSLARHLVRALAEGREAQAAFERAEATLLVSLQKGTNRAEILRALAREREAGRLSTEAFRQLLATTARLYKSNIDLLRELDRVGAPRD